MSECKDCRKLILWNEKMHTYVDARHLGDEIVPVVAPGGKYISHKETCPVKIKQRIHDNCAWCLLEDGRNILTIRSKFEFMKCERHDNEQEDVQYRGKTYKRTNETLRLMYWEATKEKKRVERKAKKGEGTAPIEGFLSN